MSVAYRSWEVTNGPIVGFNMAIQSNACATADALLSETSICCNNTVLSHEAFIKAVAAGTDVSKGLMFPNHKAHSPPDTVIRGFSSLSLHSQSQLQAGSPSKDCETSPSYESSAKSLELNGSVPSASNGTNLCCFAAHSAGYQTHHISGPQKSTQHDGSGFKGFEDVSCCMSASQPHLDSSDTQQSISCNSFWGATTNFIPLCDNYRYFGFQDFSKHTLDVVVEDKPFEENFTVATNGEFEVDALPASSTNSVSFLNGLPVDGSVSLGEEFSGVEEFEAESAFKGSSTFTRAFSPPRKGVSRFYAGKSRSFSCLGDVMSMSAKDLAKPENPYAKKRRYLTGCGVNTGHPQLPPLQKGAATISKKVLHSGKSTLALGVTMSTMEDDSEREDNHQISLKALRSGQKSPLTFRSYSLSDLQRVSEHQVSGC